ncbi:MAG: hypothetical protein LCH89_04680 [Proteobacteria bacterium]|nr:hypothetical protein [Pseudomonadota bacterium]
MNSVTAISPPARAQRGLALVFVLLMLAIAMTAALFAARMTLLGDKASRNDRDRQIAFQAAELALADAELDLMDVDLAKATGSSSRGCKFANPAASFVADPGCSANSNRRGLCGITPSSLASPSVPMYKQIDWEETDDNARVYVKYGEFTGRSSQLVTGDGSSTGQPPQPAKAPKYIIVQAPGKQQIALGAGNTFQMQGAFKVYALGYGVNPNTKVLLEGDFYKPVLDKACN